MKLYELAPQFRALTEFLNEETGEVKYNEETFKTQLAQITVELKDKAENIGKLILENDAEVDAISKEVVRLSNRKRILENRTDWLKNYVTVEMQTANLDKIQGQVITLSLQKSPPSCVIVDEKLIPTDCFRIIPEKREVDKAKILSEFKLTGEVKPGTSIVTDKKSLRIR